MADRPRCGAEKEDGSRCASTILVDGDRCLAHSEQGGSERMAEHGRRGGLARSFSRNGPPGLEAYELPALETVGDAKVWLETVGRAVAVGRLGEKQAHATIRAVEAWTTAHSEHLAEEKLREVVEEIEQAKERAAAA